MTVSVFCTIRNYEIEKEKYSKKELEKIGKQFEKIFKKIHGKHENINSWANNPEHIYDNHGTNIEVTLEKDEFEEYYLQYDLDINAHWSIQHAYKTAHDVFIICEQLGLRSLKIGISY